MIMLKPLIKFSAMKKIFLSCFLLIIFTGCAVSYHIGQSESDFLNEIKGKMVRPYSITGNRNIYYRCSETGCFYWVFDNHRLTSAGNIPR